jgi:virulence-associated protein VapD
MYRKFKLLGQLGKYLYNQGKDYYKSGGKKTKDIIKESKVSKNIAKADIKSEIKRRAFRNKKPSDFIPRTGIKGLSGTVKSKITTKQSKYQSDLRRFNEGFGRDPRKK